MKREDKDLMLGVADAFASVAASWLEYKNRPPEPLDPRVKAQIDDFLEKAKAEPTERTLRSLKNFLELFRGRLPEDLLKILRFAEKEIEDLLKAERDRRHSETLGNLRGGVRRKVGKTIPDPNVFYCDPSGGIAKGKIDMK